MTKRVSRQTARRHPANPEYNAKNLNNLTPPEIKNFNALSDTRSFKFFALCFNGAQSLRARVLLVHHLSSQPESRVL